MFAKLQSDLSASTIELKYLQTWCLQNNRQDLLNEWDYEKNGNLTPCNTTYGSAKKVWWVGKCGHKMKLPLLKQTRLINAILTFIKDMYNKFTAEGA